MIHLRLLAILLWLAVMTLCNAADATPTTDVADVEPVAWPERVATPRMRLDDETNAQRMQRGLGPKAPTKVYDSHKRNKLQARVSPPAQAYGGFTFLECTTINGGTSSLGIVLGGPATALANCVTRAIMAQGQGQIQVPVTNIILRPVGGMPNTFFCAANTPISGSPPSTGFAVACSPSNSAVYLRNSS